MTKWKHVFRNFYKLIKDEKLKCRASISTQSLSQHLVEAPLAAIAASTLLVYVCISFAHLDLGIFSHSSLQICSSPVKLDGERRWTAIFKSFHRFSMGFKSWLSLGHCRTFTFMFWSHSSVALAVCLGSLSCWNVNLHRSLRSFALWSRFSSRIYLYLAPFIVPSILTSLAVPATKKHPHSMMLPPPCFTVGMLLDGSRGMLGFHQT